MIYTFDTCNMQTVKSMPLIQCSEVIDKTVGQVERWVSWILYHFLAMILQISTVPEEVWLLSAKDSGNFLQLIFQNIELRFWKFVVFLPSAENSVSSKTPFEASLFSVLSAMHLFVIEAFWGDHTALIARHYYTYGYTFYGWLQNWWFSCVCYRKICILLSLTVRLHDSIQDEGFHYLIFDL